MFPKFVLCTLAALSAAVAVAAAGGGAAPARVLRFEVPRRGVSFTYPATWHVTLRRLDVVLDPHTLFTASSYVVPRGPRADCDGTRAAGRPDDGAFVLVKEILDGASRKRSLPRLLPKPRRFVLPARGRAGCLPPVSATFQFRAAGRAFYAFVSVGPHASRRTRAAARHVLESMRVRPLR